MHVRFMPFSSFSDLSIINVIDFHFYLVTDVTYLQHGGGHVGLPFLSRPNGMAHGSDLKNLSHSPRSISGTKSGHFCEVWFFLWLQCYLEKVYAVIIEYYWLKVKISVKIISITDGDFVICLYMQLPVLIIVQKDTISFSKVVDRDKLSLL